MRCRGSAGLSDSSRERTMTPGAFVRYAASACRGTSEVRPFVRATGVNISARVTTDGRTLRGPRSRAYR
jgi:hypothetical protein